MKTLVNDQNLSWDWLLDGKPPTHSPARDKRNSLSTKGINQRFLSLFPGLTQQQLAESLDIRQPVVAAWAGNTLQVSWEKLRYAVMHKNTSWEWLLEGIGSRDLEQT